MMGGQSGEMLPALVGGRGIAGCGVAERSVEVILRRFEA
jgi:hypothetical protein